MEHREFVSVGEPVPMLNGQEYTAFFRNLQRAVLLSLEKQGLLTAPQREHCQLELEKQHRFKQRNKCPFY